MKIGFNLLLWSTSVGPELYPVLEKLKRAGYDGVEIPVFDGDTAAYQALGTELEAQGLSATAVTVVGEDTSPISPDAKVREAAVERLKWAIDMTAAAGGEVLVGPYHSPLAVFSGTGPTEDEQKRAVEVLRRAAEYARDSGVRLAIEYLNRFECYFLTTGADARRLVKDVNHPSFGTMYDTFHANIEEKAPAPTIQLMNEVITHVHISENDRGTPGTGMVHWDETFRALKAINYDKWMVIESFGRALPALAAATKVWRDLFPAAEEVYTRGIEFIRQKWASA